MEAYARVKAALQFKNPDRVPVFNRAAGDVFPIIITHSKNWKAGWNEGEEGLFPHLRGNYRWEKPPWAQDNPLYEGIYQARLSGKIAAEIFCQALEVEDFGESELTNYYTLLLKHLYEEDLRYSYKFHYLLYHSGLLERIIEASYSMAQDDPEMMQSTIALFTGSETRKHSWEVMMSRKWKLVKLMGIKKSIKLFPTLIHALRI